MSNKVGFWTVFTIVVSAQIGSAVLFQPAYLAKYGLLSFGGLAIAAIGAVTLALMFSKLCAWFPHTGGPHIFAKEAFGKTASFFTGWTYWIVSWVSTTTVVLAAVGYISPIIGMTSPIAKIILSIFLIILITLLNFKGLKFAGKTEIFLWILKAIPLLIIPIAGLYFFNIKNFAISPSVEGLSAPQILSDTTLLILWGFVGLETATAAAGSVENACKTVPRAVISGTIFVAILYFLNTAGILGVIPGAKLAISNAPYTDAAQVIFGGNWYLAISIVSFIVLFSTLNAWVLTSGHIALGLAQDNLMPKIFSKTNKYDAPYWGLIVSCIGTSLLLLLNSSQSLAGQIEALVKVSTTAFLFVYAICCAAFFKILIRSRKNTKEIIFPLIYGLIALIFCAWLIAKAPTNELLIACLFTLSGLPVYLKFRNKK